MIPKIIHFCWLSGDAYPPKIKYCLNSWLKYLPNYEVILWDKKRFDINSNLWVKQAYEHKKYAFAADYIRLWALYHYGGIYLDSDVEVIKSLDPLLKQPYFFGVENNQTCHIEAAVMGAEAHNDFIKRCLDHYKDRPFLLNGKMDMTPLPIIMNSYISQSTLIFQESEYKINDSSIQLYSKDFFSPKDGVDGQILYKNEHTYTIHHYNASWYTKEKKMYLLLSKICGRKITSILSTLYHKIK